MFLTYFLGSGWLVSLFQFTYCYNIDHGLATFPRKLDFTLSLDDFECLFGTEPDYWEHLKRYIVILQSLDLTPEESTMCGALSFMLRGMSKSTLFFINHF